MSDFDHCEACGHSARACELLWALQRKCCPDCKHEPRRPYVARAIESTVRLFVPDELSNTDISESEGLPQGEDDEGY